MFRLVLSASALFILFLALSTIPEVDHSPIFTRESRSLLPVASSTPIEQATTTQGGPPPEVLVPESNVAEPEPQEIAAPAPSPLPLEIARSNALKAVVNILCEPEGPGGTMAVSGTGVIIDPRGVILTNAHVAQYVLLASREEINLTCVIRTGSPALKAWETDLLFLPPEWIAEHAEDIIKTRPSGTGEHDYALLLATESVSGEPIGTLPHLPIETGMDVGVVGSTVALSAYPAEFSGLAATQQFLLSSAILTPVRNILTFRSNTADVLSFGAVALAQGGSSGGAVVNENGKLIAIITTTSDKEFIAERDLRGITLSYIDRALVESLGISLPTMLAGDVAAQGEQFRAKQAPQLAQQIMNFLSQKQR